MARTKRRVAKRSSKKKKRVARNKPTSITIRRSSGRKEKFDLDRMTQTASRSGVPFLMARDIAKGVSKQIRSEAKGKSKKTVTASRVRRMIADELRSRNQQAIASSYTGGTPEDSQTQDMTKVEPYESPIGSADRDSILHDRSKRLTSSA